MKDSAMNIEATEKGNSFWKQLRFKDVFVILLLVFALQFVKIPFNTSQILILYLIIFKIILSPKRLVFPYSKDTFKSLIPFFLFAVYIAFTTLLRGGEMLGNLANIILLIYQYALGAYLVVMIVFREDFHLDKLLYTVLVLFAIQGFFILLNFLIPSYRDFLFTILPMSGNIKAGTTQANYRVRGLTQSTGDGISAFLSFGFLIAAYFFASGKLGSKDQKVVAICVFFLLIGILFTGRTGLVLLPVAAVLYYAILIRKQQFRWHKLLYLIAIPLAGVALYFLMKQVYFLTAGGADVLVKRQALFLAWEDWAFGQFVDFFTGNSQHLHTVKILNQMWFIPDKDGVLLFGDTNTWSVVRSDIGYIRILFSAGVIGGLLFYFGFVSIYINILRKLKDHGQRLLILCFLACQFLFEYKGAFFMHPYFFTFLALIFFVVMKQTDNDKRIRNVNRIAV